jgi:hypothetical protein
VNLFFELLSTLDAVGLGVRLCDLGEVGWIDMDENRLHMR